MLEEMSDEDIEELVTQVIDDMIASGKLMAGEEGEEDLEDMEDMDMDMDMDMDDDVVVKDDEETLQNMVDNVSISAGVLIFTVKGLPQSVDQYNLVMGLR